MRELIQRALADLPEWWSPLHGERAPLSSAVPFHAFPGTGAGYVLVRADSREAFLAGSELLPAGRKRWRLVRGILRAIAGANGGSVPGISTVHVPLSGGDADELVALASGVPGAHRTWVALLGVREHARVAKIAATEHAGDRVMREASALDRIGEDSDLRALGPRLLETRGEGLGTILIQERLPGKRSPDRIDERHIRFVECLARASRTESRTIESDALEARPAGLDPVFSQLAKRTDPSHVTHLAHGDFTPWNVFVTEHAARAFDWEYAEECAPALHDLFHFVVQTGVLVRRDAPAAILADLDALRLGSAADLVRSVAPTHDAFRNLFAHYLLRVSIADARRFALEAPQYAQAQWLADARIELATLLVNDFDRVGLAA